MKQEAIKMFNEQVCDRCKYQWFARTPKPRQCPNCKKQIKYLEVAQGEETSGKVHVKSK